MGDNLEYEYTRRSQTNIRVTQIIIGSLCVTILFLVGLGSHIFNTQSEIQLFQENLRDRLDKLEIIINKTRNHPAENSNRDVHKQKINKIDIIQMIREEISDLKEETESYTNHRLREQAKKYDQIINKIISSSFDLEGDLANRTQGNLYYQSRPICHDNFGDTEATVFCRSIGKSLPTFILHVLYTKSVC